jgi:hypothetical protein
LKAEGRSAFPISTAARCDIYGERHRHCRTPERRKAQVRAALVREEDQKWLNSRSTPAAGLRLQPACAHRRGACQLHNLALRRNRGRYLPQSDTVEYVVGTHEQITPGVFHKVAPYGQGLQILSAEINTLADGWCSTGSAFTTRTI